MLIELLRCKAAWWSPHTMAVLTVSAAHHPHVGVSARASGTDPMDLPERARRSSPIKVATGRLPDHARLAPQNIFVNGACWLTAPHLRIRGVRGGSASELHVFDPRPQQICGLRDIAVLSHATLPFVTLAS